MARQRRTTEKKGIIALRDFVINHNDEHFVICKGDDIIKLGVPAKFYPNLITEKIIKELP